MVANIVTSELLITHILEKDSITVFVGDSTETATSIHFNDLFDDYIATRTFGGNFHDFDDELNRLIEVMEYNLERLKIVRREKERTE